MKIKTMKLLIAAGIWNIISASSYGITIIGDEEQRGDSLQRAQEFPEVVMIQPDDLDMQATGTLFQTSRGAIGLLTAAHCTYNYISEPLVPLTSFSLLTHKGGSSFRVDPTNASIHRFATPEDINNNCSYKDLALVTFENPLEVLRTLELSIEMLPRLGSRLSHLEILEDFQEHITSPGRTYQVVGFGRQTHAGLHEGRLAVESASLAKATHKAYMEVKIRMSSSECKDYISLFQSFLRSENSQYFNEDQWNELSLPILGLTSFNPSLEEVESRKLVGFLEPGDSGAPLFHQTRACRKLIGVLSARGKVDTPLSRAGEGNFCYLSPYLQDIHAILKPRDSESGSSSSTEQA